PADRTFGKYRLTSRSMFILTNSGMSLCFQSLIISLFVLIYFMTPSATLYCILLNSPSAPNKNERERRIYSPTLPPYCFRTLLVRPFFCRTSAVLLLCPFRIYNTLCGFSCHSSTT